MMSQEEFKKWYQNNEQRGCCLAHLDRVAACNLCYTIGFLSCQFTNDEKKMVVGERIKNAPFKEQL